MRQRAAEILFRHKLLLLLPFLIILPISSAFALRPQVPQWETSARIWVEQDTNIYTDPRLGYSPAPNQASLLADFLHSRTFALAVLQQTSLAPHLKTQHDIDKALELFNESVNASAASNNFINIDVNMPDANLSYQTTQAIITNYQSTLQSQQQQLTDQALKLYGDSMQQAQSDLTKAEQGLATYLSAHPTVANYSTNLSLPATDQDPSLALLTQQVGSAQSMYDNLHDRYFGIQAGNVLSGTFAPFAFKVIDPPLKPTEPLKVRRLDLLKLPAVGLVVALLLSAGIGAILVLTDRTVVGSFDVEDVFGLPVLAEMPRIRARERVWQRAEPDAVRLRLSGPGRSGLNGNGRH